MKSSLSERSLTARLSRRSLLPLLLAVLLPACSTMPRPLGPGQPGLSAEVPREAGSITAVGFDEGVVYVARAGDDGCSIEEHRPGEAVQTIATLEECPTRIGALGDGSLRLTTIRGEMLLDDGETNGDAYPAQSSSTDYVSLSEGRLNWHRKGTAATVQGAWTGPVAILDKENAVIAVRRDAEGERVIRLQWPDTGNVLTETVLTDPFERVGGIEPDEDQKELALSVLRGGSYDIAITNAEEKITNWVPADPADELDPRWSPVGYKLSYVIVNPGGDIIRTVHVPTAAMVLLDFPDSTITDYAWLPDGERVIVAVSSLLASDHLVETDYTGALKKVLIAPQHRFERRVERLPGTPAGSALVMPDPIRYNTRHPLVVWVTDSTAGGLQFNQALVPLLERDDVGLLVLKGVAADVDDTVWDAVSEIRWTDTRHTWLVGPETAGDVPKGVRRMDESIDAGAVQTILEEIDEGTGQR